MELEELFSNRALLKEMSAQDHIQMHFLCKGVREPNSLPLLPHSPKNNSASNHSGYNNSNIRPPHPLTTPRTSTTKPPPSICSLNNPMENFNTPSGSSYSSLNKPPSSTSSSIKPPTSLTSLNKHPTSLNSLTRPKSFTSVNKPPTSSTSLNTSIGSTIIKPDESIIPPLVLVPDGYGCKLPKSCQRCTDVVKIAFLFLYIFGLPVILYQLHTNLQNTRRRIHMLKNNKVELLRSELAYAKQKQSGSSEEEYLIKEKMKDYKDASPRENDDVMLQMDNIYREIQAADDHWYRVIGEVEKWLRRNPNVVNGECPCDACSECLSKETKEKPYVSLSTVHPSAATRKQPLKSYIKWGNNVCGHSGNSSSTVAFGSTVVYHGVMVTTSNLRGSTGANYLCLPVHPSYELSLNMASEKGVPLIYNSLVDLNGYRDLMLNKAKTSGFFLAQCVRCQVPVEDIIMIPGATMCPFRWELLYGGYVMAQRVGKKRTQFLCVDSSTTYNGSQRVKKSPRIFSSLNFVETKCHGLPCVSGGYSKYAELHCIVCSK